MIQQLRGLSSLQRELRPSKLLIKSIWQALMRKSLGNKLKSWNFWSLENVIDLITKLF